MAILIKNKLSNLTKLIFLKQNKLTGFSLIELLVAMVLAIVVAGTLTIIFTNGLRNVRASNRLERLHADAVFVSDSLRYWLSQGMMVAISDPSTLDIKLLDGSIKTINLNAGKIMIGSSQLTADDIEVSSLTFSQMARSLRVSFTLKAKSGGEAVPVATTIALRQPL